MNSEAIQEFLVKLGFSVDENSLSKFMGGLDSAAIRIAGFGAAMAAVAVEVIHSVEEIANENRQLGLLAQQLNTTAGAVDDFIDTATILGISAEDSTASLKAFASNVSDAALGIGRAKIVFEKLHIAVKDANGQMRSASDVMDDLKVKLVGMNRAQQLRIMEKLGLDPKLLAMFNDAFGQTAKIADQLSAIDVATGFDLDKSIKQSNEFEKSWAGMRTEVNLFKMLFEKMHEAIAVRMMPGIQIGIEKVTKAIESARHFIMDNAKGIEDAIQPILETVIKIGAAFAQLTGRAFEIIGAIIKPIVGFISDLNKETGGWLLNIAALAVAWKVFNLGFLASPVGIILSLGVAILALVDDFKVWQEGGKSFFDWSSMVKTIEIGIELFKNGLNTIKSLFSGVIHLVKSLSALLHGDLGGFWDEWAKSGLNFMGFIDGLINQFKSLWNLVKSLGEPLGALEDKLSGMFGGKSEPVPVAAHSVAQQTVIHVNGAQSPQATAQAVAAQQNHVNAQITRNMTARAR